MRNESPAVVAIQIAPRRRNATLPPRGAGVGDEPSVTRAAGDPSRRTRQMASSAPFGSLVGLGMSPVRLGPAPRTKYSVRPSALNASDVRSCPSSCANAVTCRASVRVESVTQMLRTPRAFSTKATAFAAGAATIVAANGAPSIWRMVGWAPVMHGVPSNTHQGA